VLEQRSSRPPAWHTRRRATPAWQDVCFFPGQGRSLYRYVHLFCFLFLAGLLPKRITAQRFHEPGEVEVPLLRDRPDILVENCRRALKMPEGTSVFWGRKENVTKRSLQPLPDRFDEMLVSYDRQPDGVVLYAFGPAGGDSSSPGASTVVPSALHSQGVFSSPVDPRRTTNGFVRASSSESTSTTPSATSTGSNDTDPADPFKDGVFVRNKHAGYENRCAVCGRPSSKVTLKAGFINAKELFCKEKYPTESSQLLKAGVIDKYLFMNRFLLCRDSCRYAFAHFFLCVEVKDGVETVQVCEELRACSPAYAALHGKAAFLPPLASRDPALWSTEEAWRLAAARYSAKHAESTGTREIPAKLRITEF
jgi:hypothetical protein